MTTRPLRVLIADDEPAARRGVRQLLEPHQDFEVVRECRNGSEVLTALDAGNVDVIFLDIQMPGIDGFEVIRRRSTERMPAVIFLTAYDEFALKAFEAEALDYLVKPVTEARFAAAIRRVKRMHGTAATEPDTTLVATTPRGTTVIRIAEVDWVESADNYVRVWVGPRGFLIREPMSALEQRTATAGFVRVHRKALVRITAIRGLARSDEGDTIIVMRSGARVPVARRRRARLMSLLRRAR